MPTRGYYPSVGLSAEENNVIEVDQLLISCRLLYSLLEVIDVVGRVEVKAA